MHVLQKVDTIDYELVVTDILKYRASGIYPDYIALEEQKDEAWKESGRSLNDIIKTLSNSNFILYLDFRKRIEFQNYLTYENILKILLIITLSLRLISLIPRQISKNNI